MEFNEINKKAVDATRKRLERANFQPNIDQTIIHLIEELGEVAHQRNNDLLERREGYNQKDMGKEISDCIILLMFLASQYEVDLEKEVLDKIKDIDTR